MGPCALATSLNSETKTMTEGGFNTRAFNKELINLLNCHSVDNQIGLPDYILADHINRCLHSLEIVLKEINRHEQRDEDYERLLPVA